MSLTRLHQICSWVIQCFRASHRSLISMRPSPVAASKASLESRNKSALGEVGKTHTLALSKHALSSCALKITGIPSLYPSSDASTLRLFFPTFTKVMQRPLQTTCPNHKKYAKGSTRWCFDLTNSPCKPLEKKKIRKNSTCDTHHRSFLVVSGPFRVVGRPSWAFRDAGQRLCSALSRADRSADRSGESNSQLQVQSLGTSNASPAVFIYMIWHS